jgi:tetratricopeptide (TPR) repeat protein
MKRFLALLVVGILALGIYSSVCAAETPQENVEKYTKLIQAEPGDRWHYLKRGWAYYDLKQCDKAIAYFDSANLYRKLKEYDKGIADCTKYIALNPNNGRVYNNRGFMYKELGRHDEAMADFKKAIELNAPSSWWSCVNIADILVEQGRKKEAISYLEEALRRADPEMTPGLITEVKARIAELRSAAQ